jgi:ABC-type glycerol-3-phosphate transport system substrate-binding protein
MINKKLLSIAMIGIAATGMLFAGGSSEKNTKTDDSKIQLSIMHYFTDEQAQEGSQEIAVNNQQVKNVIANHPEISFDETQLQHEDYNIKLQALAAADDLPDVFMIRGDVVDTFNENGLLADITPYLEKSAWKDAYRDGIFTPVQRGTAIYGTPTQNSFTTLMYYNKALWAKAGYSEVPATWEGLFEAEKKFEAMGIDMFMFGNKDKWQYNSSWCSALANRFTGTDWYNQILAGSDDVAFTDPEFKAFLQLTADIGAKAGLNPDFATIDHLQAATLFGMGESALFIDGYWGVENVTAAIPAGQEEDFGVMPLPTVANAKGADNAVAGGCGWFYAVNGQLTGAELEAAADVVLELTNTEVSKTLAEKVGILGACKVDNIDVSKFSPLVASYLTVVNECPIVPIYDNSLNSSIIETQNDLFPQLLAGSISVDAAAEKIQAAYEESK